MYIGAGALVVILIIVLLIILLRRSVLKWLIRLGVVRLLWRAILSRRRPSPRYG